MESISHSVTCIPCARPISFALAALLLSACGTPPQQPPAPGQPDIVMPPPVGPVNVPPQPQPAQPPQPPAPVPPMTPVSFDTLPGWQDDDLRQAWGPFLASCRVLANKPGWQAACAAAAGVDGGDGAAIRRYFETYFVPQQMRMPDGADTGLITGYYEPMLRGARKRGGPFQTPLYRVPDDLITVDLGGIYPNLKTMRLRGRLVGKTVVPYSTRAEIARAPLTGKELVWVDDPVEAFFLEVQGSGRARIEETGETVRLAYADQNGHPYKVIGRWLVEQGELPADGVSAQSIKAWLVAHPERRQELFNVNPSTVFFREERLPDPGLGPKGALGVPLTPERSVAVDPQQVPLGAPLFLSTTHPATGAPLQRLMMAQDTGGAIRGAVRADFFFGFGGNAAEYAGRMKQRGALWALLPKAD